MVLFTLITVTATAQSNVAIKSKVFDNFPSIVQCSNAELNQIFVSVKGKQVAASFSNTLKFSGDVISNTIKYNKLHSITMKLPAYNNAIFSLTRRLDENNQMIYVGHIFNQNSSDGYQLKRSKNNTYQFEKIKLEEILTDCAHQ